MKKSKNRILTFITLFSAATLIIHILNKIIALSASLKEMLDITNKNYYEWRFGKVYYTKKGKGSPILLIHDTIPGSSGYEWNRIERELSTEHTVYTVDLLGYGRSEKSGMTYTNFVYVQMISDFIKNIIGEKTDVIASGFSSSFVIMACRNDQKYFNKLMLVNPPSIAKLNQMPAKKDNLLKFFIQIPVFGTLIYHIIVSEGNIRNMFIENFYYNPFHLDQDMLDAFYEGSHKGGYYAKYSYASLASKYMNINIAPAMKAIDNSIYIVQGVAEQYQENIIEDYMKINSSIECATVDRAKHFPQVENPEAFMEHVGIFF